MANRFTENAQSALNAAPELASKLGHNYIGSEHLLLGICFKANSIASRLLELKGIDGGTTRTALGNDAERTMEQVVEKRMKEMILPSISFRPPATIADAVEYFKQASRDFDRPDIPIDQRGFNFVLDLGKQLLALMAAARVMSLMLFAGF